MAVLGLTSAGFVAAQSWPGVYLAAIAVCLVAAMVLTVASLRHPRIAALRAAAVNAVGSALISVVVGLLLATGNDYPLEVRVALRAAILGLAAAPAAYWLLLWFTGGFEARS